MHHLHISALLPWVVSNRILKSIDFVIESLERQGIVVYTAGNLAELLDRAQPPRGPKDFDDGRTVLR